MAPTAILASQHLESFNEILAKYGIKCELLIGSVSKKKKEEMLEKLKNGEIDILIGTHALLEENVIFKNLGLVVTDEQHRFGVRQRATISKKGENPDVSTNGYKQTDEIKVLDGDIITVICGDKSWEGSDSSLESNVYTFKIKSNIKPNTAPTLNKESDSQTINLGETYSVDLSTIFTDAENDELSYTVSIDKKEEESVSANYSFKPEKTGNYELEFRANDGKETSDPYTVKLAVDDGQTYKVNLQDTKNKSIKDYSTLANNTQQTKEAEKEDTEECQQVMNLSDEQINLLSKLVAAEARGESYEGQVAVAAVVLNRVQDSRFPDSIEGVIYQKNAFSVVRNGYIKAERTEESDKAVKDALYGNDPTNNAIYFWNPDISTCNWINTLNPHLRIGNHVFAR